MRFRITLPTLLLAAGSFALPLVAYAGIPFFGPIIPQAYSTCPASWGLLITVINNVIALLITLAIVFVAPLMIAYSGFLFVVNPVDSGGISKAKGILTNTIVGIVIALAGWMIVDALMAVLYNPGAAGGTWSSLITSGTVGSCIQQTGAPFTPGSAPAVGVVTTTNEQAVRNQLLNSGIAINHDPCPPGSDGQGCTNVGGMQTATINQIIGIKNACGASCAVIVTGGTEPGHAAGTYSHGNGYKVDLSLNSAALNTFLQQLPLNGQRGGDFSGPIRTDTCGNQYVQESNHWDIRILQTCNL